VRREQTRRATAGRVDVAVEDVGYLHEGRILRLRADLIRADAVVEDSEPRADRGLAVAEDIVADTDTRRPVVPIGFGSARGKPHKQALQRGIVVLRQAAPGGVRELAVENGDAVVRVARARSDGSVSLAHLRRAGRIEKAGQPCGGVPLRVV